MLKKICFPGLLLTLCLGSGCFRADTRTLEFRVPELDTEPDAEILRQAFIRPDRSRMPGVYRLDIDPSTQSVRITFNNAALGEMNLEERIAAAGFRVRFRPAATAKTIE